MNRFFMYILYFVFFYTNIIASEPTLATLRSVSENEYQTFSIGMFQFTCRPYGVLTIDELYYKSELDSECRKSINEFYLQNPMSRYFSENLLKIRQLYHIEFKENRCILYTKGKLTMSELLIKKGLGVIKPRFKDKEFEYPLKKAYDYAKRLEVGLFKNKITNSCIEELYKE